MPRQPLEQRFFSVRIIYLALVGTLGLYAFIAYQNAMRAPARPLDPTFLYGIAGVVLMQMVGIPFLRRAMLPPMATARSLDDQAALDSVAAEAAFAKYFTAHIITWALCESMAIYGLVLVFMTNDLRYYWPFAGVALLNFLFYRPSVDDLQAALRAAKS